ncbi:MAG: VCBS repeat-containing protein [Anaerolineales bacterium]|nr:VCBS repeat-containing protein [Anaerolineales bacterium]
MILPATWTPLPSPASATPTSTTTPSPVEIPTFSPAPTVTPLPSVYAILGGGDGILLGGVSIETGAWISADALEHSKILQPMDLYRRDEYLTYIRFSLGFGEPACPETQNAQFTLYGNNALSYSDKMDLTVAISSVPWAVNPTSINWLAPQLPAYQKPILDWLVSQGLENPSVTITDIAQLDLDQDGANEVVLRANNIQDAYRTTAGDYSIVVVRKLVGNTVETIPVVADVYLNDDANTQPRLHHLTALMDFNGDGKTELMVDTMTPDARQTYIFELKAAVLQPVLSVSCRGLYYPFVSSAASSSDSESEPGTTSDEPSATSTPEFGAPVEGKYYVIVAGEEILGGVRDGEWLDLASASDHFTPGDTYHLYSGLTYQGAVVGVETFIPTIGCNGYESLSSVYFEPSIGFGSLAISGPWNALPRVPSLGNNKEQAYLNALAPLLRKGGVGDSPVLITDAWIIDLDKDGTDEVVVSANRQSSYAWPYANGGDYNLVAVLYPKEDKYVAVELVGDYYKEKTDYIAPDAYRIWAVLDLNGDNKMEVIVRGQHYEGGQTLIYTYKKQKASLVLGLMISQWKGCSWVGP